MVGAIRGAEAKRAGVCAWYAPSSGAEPSGAAPQEPGRPRGAARPRVQLGSDIRLLHVMPPEMPRRVARVGVHVELVSRWWPPAWQNQLKIEASSCAPKPRSSG